MTRMANFGYKIKYFFFRPNKTNKTFNFSKITFQDWMSSFERLQICYIPQSSKPKGNKWKELQYDGEWSAVKTGSSFWSNPQYLLEFKPNRKNLQSDIIVECMQKNVHQKRKQSNGQYREESIQLRVFKVKDNVVQRIKGRKLYPIDLERVGDSGDYTNSREVTFQCSLPAVGRYLIIPSKAATKTSAQFLIRVFTEAPIDFSVLNIDGSNLRQNEFKFYDGKGPEKTFGIREWSDYLPPGDKKIYKNMRKNLSDRLRLRKSQISRSRPKRSRSSSRETTNSRSRSRSPIDAKYTRNVVTDNCNYYRQPKKNESSCTLI
jgi:hypothetical protein